ncbi:hypothetical protein M8J76_007408, partial [Diaphorina citri]
MPSNQGGNMPSNQGGNMPSNQGGNMPSNQGGNMPSNQGGNMPSNQGGNMPSNQGGNMPSNQGGNMPSNQGGNMPSNQGGNMPSNQGGNMPSNQGGNMTPNPGGDGPSNTTINITTSPTTTMNIITSPTTTKNNNNQLRGGSVRQVRGISKAEGGRIEPIFTQAMASNFLDYSYTICIHLKPGFCSVVFQSDSKFNVGKKVGNTCDKDMPFVIIPNDGVQDRFCGNIQPFPELT